MLTETPTLLQSAPAFSCLLDELEDPRRSAGLPSRSLTPVRAEEGDEDEEDLEDEEDDVQNGEEEEDEDEDEYEEDEDDEDEDDDVVIEDDEAEDEDDDDEEDEYEDDEEDDPDSVKKLRMASGRHECLDRVDRQSSKDTWRELCSGL